MSSSPVLLSKRPGLRIQRRVRGARAGLVHVEQSMESQGVLERAVVTHEFWLFAVARETAGLTEAYCQDAWVRLPAWRAFLIPPRSLLRLRLSDVRLNALGMIGRGALPPALNAAPRVAAWSDALPVPSELSQLVPALAAARALDPDAEVGSCAREARHLLHDALAHPSPVRTVASQLGVAPDTVTRAFRAAYLMTPKAYVQRARISEAALWLTAGASVMRAALAAQFNDLSRFYRAFGRTGNTPGDYAVLYDRKAPRRMRADEPG